MNRVGQLLIAHPNLKANNPFAKTVIYIYEHNDNGVMGLVLNKPSSYTIKELCASKGYIYSNGINKLHHGGPINENALVLLHSHEWNSSNTAHAGQGFCVSSDNLMLEKISHGNEPIYWRLFSGMSSWGPGQLDMEMNGQFPYRPENSWLTATATDAIMFEYDGEAQWRQAIELSKTQMINQFF